MHARALEISWHEKTCVWSVDVSLFQGVTRLVSAGSDKVVRIWRLPNATSTSVATTKATKSSAAPDGTTANVGDDIKIEWLSDLRAHTSNVNAVRFSPGWKRRCASTCVRSTSGIRRTKGALDMPENPARSRARCAGHELVAVRHATEFGVGGQPGDDMEHKQ